MRNALIWVALFVGWVFAAPISSGPYTSLDGKRIALLAEGKPVLLDFWASWCVPCRFAVPELNQFAKEHPNVRVIGVNADDAGDFENARRFIKVTKMEYPSIVDIPDQISERLQVDALPTLILLDAKGQEIRRWIGAPEDLREQIGKALTERSLL